MGSMGWSHFVPYQPDIKKALNDLRNDVKASGEFLGAQNYPADADESEIFRGQGDSATHSVLDIMFVSDTPDMCCASPLDAETLTELFGTTQPTHEQVQALEREINEPIDRMEARYLIVYREGEPSEIFFSGNTGF